MVDPWVYCKFGLIVTGEGEEQFLPKFLRTLASTGQCTFPVLRRIEQRSPITSPKRLLKMTGTGQEIPDKDVTEIGLPARAFLQKSPDAHVLVIDDLEYDRRSSHAAVYGRYRAALDAVLSPDLQARASVHFMVHMVEAYYFAYADAVNSALDTDLADHDGDVETIRHPKGELKRLYPGYREVGDGLRIVGQLDLERVLGDPGTCASLRTLVKWCWFALGREPSDQYQLLTGVCSPVTDGQVATLRGR